MRNSPNIPINGTRAEKRTENSQIEKEKHIIPFDRNCNRAFGARDCECVFLFHIELKCDEIVRPALRMIKSMIRLLHSRNYSSPEPNDVMMWKMMIN